ncbi:MAG: ribosome recycling factor [Candidatus Kerfeldbacteria bacterium]|nr:ribosome recycling factor [Candidatus Kerfeldbacteria bacterium]
MTSPIIEKQHYQFDEAVAHFKHELSNIRTGRANPAVIEQLLVDYYGTKTPLIQIASITVPDSHSLVVQPWDQNALKDIEKTLRASDLGFNPVNEGHQIRIPIPPLTEDRRKELAKIVHEKAEMAHISVRTVREAIWKELKDAKANGSITEDDLFKQQKELQKVIDEHNAEIKSMSEEKEREIMTL